jgi:hypothetical protein
MNPLDYILIYLDIRFLGMPVYVRLSFAFLLLISTLYFSDFNFFYSLISSYISGHICFSCLFFSDESSEYILINLKAEGLLACQFMLGHLSISFVNFFLIFCRFLRFLFPVFKLFLYIFSDNQ